MEEQKKKQWLVQVGTRVWNCRTQRGLSREKLAERLDITPQHLSGALSVPFRHGAPSLSIQFFPVDKYSRAPRRIYGKSGKRKPGLCPSASSAPARARRKARLLGRRSGLPPMRAR